MQLILHHVLTHMSVDQLQQVVQHGCSLLALERTLPLTIDKTCQMSVINLGEIGFKLLNPILCIFAFPQLPVVFLPLLDIKVNYLTGKM